MSTSWGHDRHLLISVEEAWKSIAENVQPLGTERVSIQTAYGRILAEPIHLQEDFPAFDKAAMDGFAVRSADCAQAGARLQVVGEVAAGSTCEIEISSMQAARINTGAKLPKGADAVVRIEDTRETGQLVELLVAVARGNHVRQQGADRKKGDACLLAPVRLGPAQVAAAAASGLGRVLVAREVSAAILPTGDELIAPGQARLPGQTYESNEIALRALVQQFGGRPVPLGIVPDDPAQLRSKFQEALKHPVVITAGGMSMGTLDLVPKIATELGVRWLFHGVNMRPGKPVAYGRGPQGQHVVGLPGNPVSVFVCAWLFARMIIRGLLGLQASSPETMWASLGRAMPAGRDPRPAFIPGRIRRGNPVGGTDSRSLIVEPAAWSGSDDPFGLAEANCLMVRRNPVEALAAAAWVECIPLDHGLG